MDCSRRARSEFRAVLIALVVSFGIHTSRVTHAQPIEPHPSENLVHACVSSSNGLVRIVDPGDACGKWEAPLTWKKDSLAIPGCQPGEILTWDGTAFGCAANRDTLGDLQCEEDDVVNWTGSEWACTAPAVFGASLACLRREAADLPTLFRTSIRTTVECPSGMTVTGGGIDHEPRPDPDANDVLRPLQILTSHPNDALSGWRCGVWNSTRGDHTWTCYAVCCEVAPAEE